MFPQLESVISARLTEPLAEVSKYTSCALVLLLVALRGQCFLIQASRRWAVVISMLVLSLTITDTFCHRTSPREESTCKINHTAATQHMCDGQRRVGGSQVAPLRFIKPVSTTTTITGTTNLPIYHRSSTTIQTFTIIRVQTTTDVVRGGKTNGETFLST